MNAVAAPLRIAQPLLLLCCIGTLASSQTLSIATANPTGLYYPLGGGLASIWSKQLRDINIKAEATAGSVTNLIQVAKLESDIGFSQEDAIADAVAGRGSFREALPLKVLARLYPNLIHLVTLENSGIRSIHDLAGKRVSVGPPGSGNQLTTWNILNAIGITEVDFSLRQLNYNQTTNGIKDGTLDAGFIAGGIGVAAVAELAVARNMVLVPFSDEDISQISAHITAYSGFTVPPGIYRGVNQPVQVPTLWNVLVVNTSMDEDLAYRLLEIMFRFRADLEKISSVARFITPETARNVAPLPLHSGAAHYYDDVLGTSSFPLKK